MNVLFVTYGDLSVRGGNSRSGSILLALADAGHQVDVIASRIDLSDHPHIRVISGTVGKRQSLLKLKLQMLKATGRSSYDVVHAVDDSILFASHLCRLRKIKLVYDAIRCFTGKGGSSPSLCWRLMPKRAVSWEKRFLLQSAATITSCSQLTAELKAVASDAHVVQVDNVPLQSLVPRKEIERFSLLKRFRKEPTAIVVCCVLPGNSCELNKIFMTARKVIEAMPGTAFFFTGLAEPEAESIALKLDIQDQCTFLAPNEAEVYLAALGIANAAWLVPEPGGRYIHEEVFTLLRSPAPLVCIHDSAYNELLSPKNAVQVLSDIDSLAEGILQVIMEPLFSVALATEGQQLVADHFSLSSFKHKIRMTYHTLLNN